MGTGRYPSSSRVARYEVLRLAQDFASRLLLRSRLLYASSSSPSSSARLLDLVSLRIILELKSSVLTGILPSPA